MDPQRLLPVDRLFNRPPIEKRLNEWAPVTVVRGSTGDGKTTAIARWFENQSPEDVTKVWITAQPVTDGLESFESCLSRLLRTGNIVPQPTPGDYAPSGLDELAAALLMAPRHKKFLLVIDDFHHVRDQQTLAALAMLIERHRHFHLYVSCLGRHIFEWMASGVDINVIGSNELRLGIDEIVDLAQAMGTMISRPDATKLHQTTGGWISVVKVALAASGVNGPQQAAVDHYLRTAVLSEVKDGAVVEHLLRLSLAKAVTWSVFCELFEDAEPAQLLEELDATGLLEQLYEGEEELFTIRSPVRALLRRQCISVDPKGAQEIHRRLAASFARPEDRRYISFAFHHAVMGRDWKLMDQLWSDHLLAMLCGDACLLSQTLDCLVPNELTARPLMHLFREVLKVFLVEDEPSERQAAIHTLAETGARLTKTHWETMSTNDLLVLATASMIQLRLLGRLRDSAAFGDRIANKVSVPTAGHPVAEDRTAWFHLQRGVTFSLLEDEVKAVRCYKLAWKHASSSGFDPARSQAAEYLAMTYALEGDIAQAREWLHRHLSFDACYWPGDLTAGVAGHVAAGLLALDRLDELAVRSEIDYLAGHRAHLELWPFVAYLLAEQAVTYSSPQAGLAYLDRVQSEHGSEHVDDRAACSLLDRARADLLIACGRGDKAKLFVDARPGCKAFNRVPAARIRLLGGRNAVNDDLLTWDAATPIRDRIELLLIGAVAALQRNDERSASRRMTQALESYRDSAVLRPFASISAADLARLLDLTEQRLELDDIVLLQRQSAFYPETLCLIELSKREMSVLEALAVTDSRQEMADALYVSLNTVKTQLTSIYQKLGASSRAEALAAARDHELLPRSE